MPPCRQLLLVIASPVLATFFISTQIETNPLMKLDSLHKNCIVIMTVQILNCYLCAFAKIELFMGVKMMLLISMRSSGWLTSIKAYRREHKKWQKSKRALQASVMDLCWSIHKKAFRVHTYLILSLLWNQAERLERAETKLRSKSVVRLGLEARRQKLCWDKAETWLIYGWHVAETCLGSSW